ncbi:hypothetical protein [Desulfovibrio sp. DV]|uniref:hypothetical protein n=1 Tax=Desulfovibrio sp. DV TaxID=1844708 RepID=UPI000ACE6878|nr:hypothetical protein [Desulfovibrio sp. DV]
MFVKDIVRENTRFYVKSEFAPTSTEWPALSFSVKGVAKRFANIYSRGSDYVVTVGTSNADNTKDPAHRQSIMSIMSVEPRTLLDTRTLVSKDVWSSVVKEYGQKWEWSLPVEKAFTVVHFPRARAIIPQTYSLLGKPQNFGRCVELLSGERKSLYNLLIEPVKIAPTPQAQDALDLNTDDVTLKKEISRLIKLILHDVECAGQEKGGVYPPRNSPNVSELFLILMRKWREQGGRCGLCGAPIPLATKNYLLQMSRDRLDSDCKTYDMSNLHITHLGCNLGKNKASLEDWYEFLGALRA